MPCGGWGEMRGWRGTEGAGKCKLNGTGRKEVCRYGKCCSRVTGLSVCVCVPVKPRPQCVRVCLACVWTSAFQLHRHNSSNGINRTGTRSFTLCRLSSPSSPLPVFCFLLKFLRSPFPLTFFAPSPPPTFRFDYLVAGRALWKHSQHPKAQVLQCSETVISIQIVAFSSPLHVDFFFSPSRAASLFVIHQRICIRDVQTRLPTVQS